MHTHPIKFLVAVARSWRDLLTVLVALFLLYWLMDWVEYANRPTVEEDGRLTPSRWGFLYELAKYGQVLTAALMAVCLPWLMMAITMPKTYGAFVHGSAFDRAWECLGAANMSTEAWDARLKGSVGLDHGNAVRLAIQIQSAMRVYFAFLAVLILAWFSTK
jgi:hypothetical protein